MLDPIFKQNKHFLPSIILVSTHFAKLKIKTENGGQCASLNAFFT